MAAIAEILANPSVPVSAKVKAAAKHTGGNIREMQKLLKKHAKIAASRGTLEVWARITPKFGKGRKGKKKASSTRAYRGYRPKKVTAAEFRSWAKAHGYRKPKKRKKKSGSGSSGYGTVHYDQSGMADAMVGEVVGRRVRRKRKSRGLFGPVALNPSFGVFNPKSIVNQGMESLQVGLGVVGGIAAAKYFNDLVFDPLMDKVFKRAPEAKVPLWQRALNGVLVSTFLPYFTKMIPGDLGRRVTAGSRVGGMLYLMGGIEIKGKPVLPIGSLIGAEEAEIMVDRNVQSAIEANELDSLIPDLRPDRQLDSDVGSYDLSSDRVDAGNENQLDSGVQEATGDVVLDDMSGDIGSYDLSSDRVEYEF